MLIYSKSRIYIGCLGVQAISSSYSIYKEYSDCNECTPGVYYYELRQCTTGTLTDVEITQSMNIGQALVWNNQCWTVNAIASGGQQIVPTSFHANCNTCP